MVYGITSMNIIVIVIMYVCIYTYMSCHVDV